MSVNPDRAQPVALDALGLRIGHRFCDAAALERALTHSSWANEHPPSSNQEPLAFIGDAALALVVAERLVAEDVSAPVGVLTPRRAEIVSGANLARWAADLGLGVLVRLGRGEDLTGGRTRESILATTFEAVLGVIYMEGGLRAVGGVVDRLSRGSDTRVVG